MKEEVLEACNITLYVKSQVKIRIYVNPLPF